MLGWPRISHFTVSIKKSVTYIPRRNGSSISFDALPLTPREQTVSHLTRRAQLANIALRIVEIPKPVRQRLELMIKQFGHKQKLESLGDLLMKQQRLRTHVELPRILPSQFSPTVSGLDDYERLADKAAFGRIKDALIRGPNAAKSDVSIREVNPKMPELTPELRSLATKTARSEGHRARIMQLAIDTAEHAKTKYYFRERIPFFTEAAIAFVGHTLPARVAVYSRIFSEIQKRTPLFKPSRYLEFGAKGAPAIVAAESLWGAAVEEEVSVSAVAVESSKKMIEIGQFLLADSPWNISWREQYNCAIENQLTHNTYDVVALTYALGDLPTFASRSSLVQGLWNQLNYGGFLIIVEPGTPTGFRWIHDIRELFIGKLGESKFHFFSPCPHEKACPLGASSRDWCRSGQKYYKLPKYIYATGTRQREYAETQFSYVVIRKGPGPRFLYKTEEDADKLEDKSYFWSRIVARPKHRPKECSLQVCTHAGHCERLVTRSAHPKELGHKSARHACSGDLWPHPSKVEKLHSREETVPALLTFRREKALDYAHQHQEIAKESKKELENNWAAEMVSQFAE